MNSLGRFYLGYGFLVGAPLFLLLLVGTQAAHSSAEALLAILLGVLAPMPMLLLGVALRRGWKAAPILCIATPVAFSFVVAQVWGLPHPTRADGLLRSAIFDAKYGQLYYLPGMIVLGAVVAIRATLMRDRVANAH